MKPHILYLGYVLKHKAFVLAAGFRTRTPLSQLLVHDLSKFSRAEWSPYVRRFYGDGSRNGFKDAWAHHLKNNPHHWQYWVSGEVANPMPERYVREMVADWSAAGRGIEGTWDMSGYYQSEEMNLHPETRTLVEEIIRDLGYDVQSSNESKPSGTDTPCR